LVRRPLIGLLYQLRTIYGECGAVGGMRIGRGNRSTRRKPAPVTLCPPQIPHDLTWAQTWAAAVESGLFLNLVSSPTVRVRSQVGFMLDKVALGRSFSECFCFYPPILIPPTVPHSSIIIIIIIIRGWYNRLSGGLRTNWAQSHPNLRLRKFCGSFGMLRILSRGMNPSQNQSLHKTTRQHI
jgi:hypothetical protein